MAEGIVTTDDTMFEQMLAASSPEIRSLTRRARALTHEVLPGTVEVVWPHQRSAGYGTGPRNVKVRTPQELHDPALRRLVQVATTHRVPPLPDP
jgi:hypothetical protein